MRNWLHYKTTDNSVISSVPANITSKRKLLLTIQSLLEYLHCDSDTCMTDKRQSQKKFEGYSFVSLETGIFNTNQQSFSANSWEMRYFGVNIEIKLLYVWKCSTLFFFFSSPALDRTEMKRGSIAIRKCIYTDQGIC